MRSPTRVAFAHAVEDASGLQPDRELRITRTVLLELERLYNHLHDIGAICAGVGFTPGTMAFAALKDRAQQINAAAFGHRFLFGTLQIGRGALALDSAGSATRESGNCASCTRTPPRRGASSSSPRSLQARLDGIGVLGADDARRLGAVGPAARAAGIREDVRTDSPRLAYDGFTPATLHEPTGDVGARLRLRAVELETTYEMLEDLLAGALASGTSHRYRCNLAAGHRARREPARRHDLRRRAGRRLRDPSASAHRLLRQLASARPRRRRQPAARLPADQQELRALLRLRRSLMFILLRQLAAIRREARLERGRARSLAMRHVDAGSCNGCEHELGAVTNPFHDLQRHGLDIVASPRHADILLVTGPVTTRMAGPLQTAYQAMPEPRLVAALGDCALGCNMLGETAAARRRRSKNCSRSTSAFPAVRQRPKRSPITCSAP